MSNLNLLLTYIISLCFIFLLFLLDCLLCRLVSNITTNFNTQCFFTSGNWLSWSLKKKILTAISAPMIQELMCQSTECNYSLAEGVNAVNAKPFSCWTRRMDRLYCNFWDNVALLQSWKLIKNTWSTFWFTFQSWPWCPWCFLWARCLFFICCSSVITGCWV